MYTIDQDFVGGNIIVVKTEENKAFLRPDMRGTNGEWFYFNFRVRGAAGKEITFDVGGNYVSPFGVSISHDGVHYAFIPKRCVLRISNSAMRSPRTRTKLILPFPCPIKRKDFTDS